MIFESQLTSFKQHHHHQKLLLFAALQNPELTVVSAHALHFSMDKLHC